MNCVKQQAGDGLGGATYHHAEPGGEDAAVLHHTVSRLEHALGLSAVATHGQTLQGLAKVAKRSQLLLPLTSVALLYEHNIFNRKIAMTNTNSQVTMLALHAQSASGLLSLDVLISFWRSFCFSAFLRWPVFFLGIFDAAFVRRLVKFKTHLSVKFIFTPHQ